MSTSSLEQAILKISKVMEDFVEKVQDSIEKLTNLDIARGKRKLPPQPHHNLQGTNAKRSRKVLKIDTLVGIAMTTLWTNLPLKIIRFKMTKGYLNPLKHPLLQGREEKRIPLDQMGRMPILFGDPGGIQHEESIASNGARFGVETKKLWPFEEDCAKLNGNVAAAPHFAIVGHVFGALSGAQIMHTISLFEA
ncbi:hypothetical protein CK203_054638 [Vitis vinifera]|uniref:Uncharacterized protein n=1 Tax=Vitis vinifera TaxID=29760 RepID=A0A438H930_VITVI|nr:hypothetical protein CK203_054638 [Vitis vinifera]